VGRRGKEEPVLEARCKFPDCSGDLRVDGILLPARRGRMMGLVQDQESATAECSQSVNQRAGVSLVNEQAV